VSIYRFIHEAGPGDTPEHPRVIVEFDDANDPSLEHVVDSFVSFLLGVSFAPGPIREFINSELL